VSQASLQKFTEFHEYEVVFNAIFFEWLESVKIVCGEQLGYAPEQGSSSLPGRPLKLESPFVAGFEDFVNAPVIKEKDQPLFGSLGFLSFHRHLHLIFPFVEEVRLL
jgi:hypothetical protein